MEANYDKFSIIKIISGLDIEKSERILKKCSSPDHIARAMNSTIISLNKICDAAEKILSDEIIHALLAQKYLEYDRKIKNNKVKYSVIKELAELLPDECEITKLDNDEGFYIGDCFIKLL